MTNQSPEFSIVVPVCDDRRITGLFSSLKRCKGIDQAEVIVVKNGEPDHIDGAIESFVRENPHARLVVSPDRGCSGSRNTGIREARGKYIVSLDSDVEINRNFLVAAEREIQEHPGVDVVIPMLLRDEGETVLQHYTSAHFTRLARREKPPVHNPGLIVSRRVYQSCGLLDERVRNGNDNDFKRRLKGLEIVYAPRACVIHTADSDSKFLSHTFSYGRDKSFISRVTHPAEREAIVRERLTKLLFLPKFLEHSGLGFQAALYEATIGFVGSLGFFAEEIKTLTRK